MFLQVLRNTGLIGKACKAIGLTDNAVMNYRKAHSDFDNAVQLAKMYADMRKRIEYDVKVRYKAWRLGEQRIDSNTISDMLLARFIEGFKVR